MHSFTSTTRTEGFALDTGGKKPYGCNTLGYNLGSLLVSALYREHLLKAAVKGLVKPH